MQNELKQLVEELESAKFSVSSTNPFASFLTKSGRMSRLAKLGAAKRKLRREMDRVEKQVYGGLREEVL
jgi:hypothetical protein